MCEIKLERAGNGLLTQKIENDSIQINRKNKSINSYLLILTDFYPITKMGI